MIGHSDSADGKCEIRNLRMNAYFDLRITSFARYMGGARAMRPTRNLGDVWQRRT